jgi:small subunit ribosomal protein S6
MILGLGHDAIFRVAEKYIHRGGITTDELEDLDKYLYKPYSELGGNGTAAAIVEKFKALVEQNGTLDEIEEMGKRKLAYEINYISEGYYVLVKFTSAPDFPAELDRVLGITDGVMRSLITLRAE